MNIELSRNAREVINIYPPGQMGKKMVNRVIVSIEWEPNKHCLTVDVQAQEDVRILQEFVSSKLDAQCIQMELTEGV